MENIWKKALIYLQKEVNDHIFTVWFSPIKFVSSNDASITLSVPTKFFEKWIYEKYISLISNAIFQSCEKKLKIKFIIETLSNKTQTNENNDSSTTKETIKEKPMEWVSGIIKNNNKKQNVYKNLDLNPKNTFENFVVGSNNRFAHAASKAVSEKISKIYNPLFLYGGVGLGKTHLMQAIGHEILKNNVNNLKVLYLSSEEFTNQLINAIRTKTTTHFRSMYRNVDLLLIDDIQFIAGKDSTQEEFFHTFNALHDAHKQIVICSDKAPKEIKNLEERLSSRFAWGLISDIQLPDFETRMAILQKKSENEDVKLQKEVLLFLAENIKTNIREMEGALIRVVAYSKLLNKKITVNFAQEVLKEMLSAEEKRITIPYIQKTIANFFNINDSDMKTKKRTRSITYPRQIAMYISRKLTDYSFPDIGNCFGGRNHTTVIHAYEKISKEIKEEKKTKDIINNLISLIKK